MSIKPQEDSDDWAAKMAEMEAKFSVGGCSGVFECARGSLFSHLFLPPLQTQGNDEL
jgi:hypothetical protein